MAYTVRINGVSKATGEILLNMDLYWWNSRELMNDERFIKSEENAGYLDYLADVTLEEMREIHERFRKEATTGFNKEVFQPMLKTLDEALYSRSDDYSYFRIIIYEWETGM